MRSDTEMYRLVMNGVSMQVQYICTSVVTCEAIYELGSIEIPDLRIYSINRNYISIYTVIRVISCFLQLLHANIVCMHDCNRLY